MSAIPICINCGGKDFFVDSGFYFCSECQVQSQDLRQQEYLSEHYENARKVKIPTKSPSKSDKAPETTEKQGKELTSWELLNFILVGLVDEVVSISGNGELKPITFQLWASYLCTIDVAFTSVTTRRRPRLHLAFKSKDAELVYGLQRSSIKVYKRAFSCHSGSSKANKIYVPSKKEKSKRAKGRNILKAAQLEYSESNLSSSFGSVSSKEEKASMCGVKWTKGTVSQLKDLMEVPESSRKSVAQSQRNYSKRTFGHLTPLKAVAILRLGTLLLENPILLSDLLRWDEEGYLSLSRMAKLVPEEYQVNGDLHTLLRQEPRSVKHINFVCKEVADSLGIQHLKINLVDICRRIITYLQLPEELTEICSAIVKISKKKKTLPHELRSEIKAAALIVFILKLLFGLDDRTEIITSKAVRIINSKQSVKLFVWADWQRSQEQRWAIDRNVANRRYFGVDGLSTFLGQWCTSRKESQFLKEFRMKETLTKSVERILEPLSLPGDEPKGPSPLEPNYSPNQDSIKIYLDHTRFRELAEASGVTVVKGCSRKGTKVGVSRFRHGSAKSLVASSPVTIVNTVQETSQYCSMTNYTNFLMACAPAPQNSDSDSDDIIIKPVIIKSEASKHIIDEVHNTDEMIAYLPSMEYRMYHVHYADESWLTDQDFDEIARRKLSTSLFWLITEMARFSHVSIKHIYFRLIEIEKCFFIWKIKSKRAAW